VLAVGVETVASVVGVEVEVEVEVEMVEGDVEFAGPKKAYNAEYWVWIAVPVMFAQVAGGSPPATSTR
jgi:hypothetical protein